MTTAGPVPLPNLRPPAADELPPPGSEAHLIGIAGAGMRGLALLLAEAGYRVSGCDRSDVSGLEELRRRGVELHRGHGASHVDTSSLVVHSAAIPGDAPELAAAREAGATVLKRARALAALLAERRVVGVAGTHGKTTITAMTGAALQAAGLDPVVVVGGEVPGWEGFARPGRGEVAVVEADEFDRSFLELDPSLAVVANLEEEHLDTYGRVEALEAAFESFARRAADRVGVLWCADDPGARALGERLPGRTFSYGLSRDAAFRSELLEETPDRRRCRLRAPGADVAFELLVPGDHNLRNATAALAVTVLLGADPEAAASALAGFRGVARRLERVGEGGGVAVVDDYAHHPTEVRASLEALRRRYPGARLVAVFQPHLFTRTRDFAAEFAATLGGADEAWVLPIYPSREEPIEGVTSALITEAAGGRTLRLGSAGEALERVREARQAGEGRQAGEESRAGAAGASDAPATVVVFMGAGDVTDLARRAGRLVAGEDDGGPGPGGGVGGPGGGHDDALGA